MKPTITKFTVGNYVAEQVINHNPYLFYGAYSYPEDHPKRRLNKPIWMITHPAYADITYVTNKAAAVRMMKACTVRENRMKGHSQVAHQ
jgi:hypothetical protein